LIVNNQLIDKSSLHISPPGNIYNTAPAPTKEETLTINWVGPNIGIVFLELGSFAEDLKLRSVASQRRE
jgi:hypothetical protein